MEVIRIPVKIYSYLFKSKEWGNIGYKISGYEILFKLTFEICFTSTLRPFSR